MWVQSTAAQMLGVTATALQAALDRGETIASLAQECGVDVEQVVDTVVAAELADIEALARITGFTEADVELFGLEVRAYLGTLVTSGESAAEALVEGRQPVTRSA
jgi:hypothetical protein